MDYLIVRVRELLDEMRKEKKPSVDVDFSTLAKTYQVLNMMKQIAEIADWCKEGYK